MTKKELNQLYYLNREIINKTEELVNLKIKLRDNPDWVNFGGENIRNYEKELVEKIRECRAIKKKIEKFMNGIEDSFTRQIFYYRYAKGMTWKKVAYMTGGCNTEESVRKIAERYLKAQGETGKKE